MKIVYCGLESAGKTLFLSREVLRLLKRNQKWEKKYGFKRKIYSNVKFSETFLLKYKDYICYWTDYQSLLDLNGIDILWDEISSDFSALKKEPLPRKVNRWLRQGAKQGIHIYATAQEFHDIHLDFRRRVFSAYQVKKIIGSRRSGTNIPPIGFIWGLCVARELEITPYNELAITYRSIIPSFLFISRFLCDIFDTNQVIVGADEMPFDHVEKLCKTCGYKKVFHR